MASCRTINTSSLLVYLLILLSTCLCGCSIKDSNEALLSELDTAIENRDIYQKEKENKISAAKHEILEAATQEDRFHAMGHLLDEYRSYNTDSALIICKKRIVLAEESSKSHLKIHAQLSLADVLSLMGLFKEATDIIKSYDNDSIPEYLKSYYYHINRTIYGYMADYTVDMAEKEQYVQLTDAYRDSIMLSNEPGGLYYILNQCDQWNVNGKPKEAADTLEQYLAKHRLADHETAILAYTLAESYRLLGNTEKEKEQLILSAINDMKTGVNEYVSLRKLALIYYDEGDVDRAYQYLKICMEDAQECNARLRIIEINDIFPVVNDVYLDTIDAKQRRLRWGIVLVGFLAVLAIVMIYIIYREKKKVDRARQSEKEANLKLSVVNRDLEKANQSLEHANSRMSELNEELKSTNLQLEDANVQLSVLNGDLKEANMNLVEANNSIKENSCLKEVFIAQYMGQCAKYIEKIELYQKTITKIDSTRQYGDLKKILKTLPNSETEAKEFYDNFDNTFLRLFPTFVEELNSLLLTGEAIVPKKSGSLTPELRIFALIRLGVTESDQIAKFLRYSLTTIYNYRTKVRNKAKGDRNQLEDEVAKIGQIPLA